MPFPCRFFCNGHYILQQQLEKEGVDYKMHDNSFVKVSDEEYFKSLFHPYLKESGLRQDYQLDECIFQVS